MQAGGALRLGAGHRLGSLPGARQAYTSELQPGQEGHHLVTEGGRYTAHCTLQGGAWTPRVLHTFEDVVWHVSWSVSGNILAVSGGDNKVKHSASTLCRKHSVSSVLHTCLSQVSLWKETLDEQWQCISDVSKGASTAQG